MSTETLGHGMTEAERQDRAQALADARQREKLERYEYALRKIADNAKLAGGNPSQDGAIAIAALKD